MAQRDRGILDWEPDDDEETEASWIIINGIGILRRILVRFIISPASICAQIIFS